MEDVLDLYAKPLSTTEPVVCLDEKPVPLHRDARPTVSVAPGRIAKRDYEYVRSGTANIFYAVEPKAGQHLTEVTPDRKGPQTARMFRRVAEAYPDADTIHLVVDNLNTHCEKTLTDEYGLERGRAIWSRFTLHFTPAHGSWLDQAEIGLSLLSRQCLGNRRIDELTTLRKEVKAWTREANRKRLTFTWTFTSRRARKLFHYSRRDISRSVH